jgi:hypothetical protein
MEIKIECNKCKKEQQKIKKKSNKNWKYFNMGKCECGGRFEIKFKNSYV